MASTIGYMYMELATTVMEAFQTANINFGIMGGVVLIMLGYECRQNEKRNSIAVAADSTRECVVAAMTKIPGMASTWCDIPERVCFLYKVHERYPALTLRIYLTNMSEIVPFGAVLPPYICFNMKLHAVRYRNEPHDTSGLMFLMGSYDREIFSHKLQLNEDSLAAVAIEHQDLAEALEKMGLNIEPSRPLWPI